jgi:hypothetical protein
MKLEFPQQILEKSSNIKFHKNPNSGSQLLHTEGQMNAHTDIHYLSFNNVFQKTVPTQDVTNPVKLSPVLLYLGYSSPP